MRKQAYLAALAAVSLVSCQQEPSIGNGAAGANEIAFALQSAETRAEGASPMKEGISIPLGKVNDLHLFLDETILDLDSNAPETRGTPVYTENVGYLYKDQLGVYADAAGGVDASYARLEDKPSPDGWAYQHRYDMNIWEDENTDVQFYLYMPTDMKANGVNRLAFGEGLVSADYTSPVTAAAQEDIIFGGIKMNHKQYMGRYYPQGAPVKLYHALTGIKFAIKNTTAELAKIQITKISFKNLYNTGSFTFNASTNKFNWTSKTAVEGNVLSQEFAPGDLVTYDANTHQDNHFADSFYAAGTSQNLNKADASYTFWLIPQTITGSDALLRIDYTVNGQAEFMEIRLGDLKASDWQAGQIRTYTFKLDEVNLKIEDEVEIKGNAGDGYKGSKKSAVKITNTGNVKAFIRAAIVGQWLDATNNPVFGFTDEINRLFLVESWYEDQFAEGGSHDHGEFSGLAGYDQTNPYNRWQLCKDGYYYYMDPVDPGAETSYPLFTDYVTKIAPKAQLAGEILETAQMHFELEIATQAIIAVKLDGTPYDWDAAWERALGAKPEKK